MVDTRSTTRGESPSDPQTVVRALIDHMESLTRHPNDALANAALRVQRYIEARPELLTARSFHEIYLEILRQGGTLAYQHRAREWRAVRGVSAGVYHSLLRQFRNEVNRKHCESAHSSRPACACTAVPAGLCECKN